MKRFFITGTDTDCGKTYVTTKLRDFSPRSAAIKPVASGCMEVDNQLVSSDALLLQENSDLSLNQINPWRFKLPVSPHIAAREEGIHLPVSDIATFCMEWQLPGIDTLFIEGAGGLMVPLNEDETWVDFLKLTKIPVILVVGMKLGCINHAILTEKALEGERIECAGWIANCLDPEMNCLLENITTLRKKLKSPLLATVSFFGELVVEKLKYLNSIPQFPTKTTQQT